MWEFFSPRDVHVTKIGGHRADIQLSQLCGEKSKHINLQQGQMRSITKAGRWKMKGSIWKRGRGGRGDKLERDDGGGQCDCDTDDKNECI